MGNSKERFKYEYDNQGYLIAEYLFYENGRVDTTMKCEWENGDNQLCDVCSGEIWNNRGLPTGSL